MNIGIITFHFAYNYGAVLQAWALQRYLSKLGHQVTVIDYRPPYHTERYNVHRSLQASYSVTFKQSKSGLRACRAVAGTIWDNIAERKRRRLKAILFEDFFSRNFHLSTRYISVEALQIDKADYTMVIAGSDQIWNKKLTDGSFDAAYFLDFGNKDMLRVVYATSLGETSIDECVENLRGLSFPIDYISCREQRDAHLLSNHLHRECQWVPDPTLLLSASDYAKIEEPTALPPDYYLVYILKPNDILWQGISDLIAHDANVINISPIDIRVKGLRTIQSYSPGQFLWMIKNAKCIITNSFHGTVFSVLYRKVFVCGAHGIRNLRVLSLLEQIGLDNRLVHTPKAFSQQLNEPIDYQKIEKRICQFSELGKGFLQMALQHE